MTTYDLCRQLGLTLTPPQFFACYFLEKIGLRFLVDFGVDNCIAKAHEMRRQGRDIA